MSGQHTPGPWGVHQGLDYIVVLRPEDGTDTGIQVDNIEDANLIAAAPDLLAALEMARTLLVDLEGYEVDGPSVSVIDAAIFKATGFNTHALRG